jgi:hypothetical protein
MWTFLTAPTRKFNQSSKEMRRIQQGNVKFPARKRDVSSKETLSESPTHAM